MSTIIANPNLGAKGGKKLTEAQKKKRAETRAFNKANPKPARGKRPAKGSAEAKAVGERLAASRKKKKDEADKESGANAKVELPEFGSEKLLTPKWFINKNDKTGKYNLVSPTSERRNLSTRKGMNSLEMIIKKGLAHSVVINKNIKVELSKFSKADQKRIHKHFAEIKAQSGKSDSNKSSFAKGKAKERGRPETLPKNIAANKRKGKAPTKKDEEEAKTIEEDDTDTDNDDTPTENVVISSAAKKKIGRPRKYFTKEEIKKVDVTKKQASAWHVNAMKKTGRKFTRPEGKQLKAGTFDGDDTSQATYSAHMKKQQDALTARQAKKAAKGSGLCEDCKHKTMEGGFLFDKKSRSKIAKTFKKVVTKPVGNIIKSIGKTITKAPAAIQDVAEEVGERAVNVGNKILYEDHSFPADMKVLLDKFGHEGITKAVLKRSPVNGLVTGALNVFSLGEFGERMKPFDDLFHLWIEFRLERGGEMRLEKNARITLTKQSGAVDHKDTQSQPIEESELPSDLNLDLILDRTRNYMGDKKFFQYNSSNNNCQDFITAILISNKIGTQQDRVWVKQDTKHLFKDMPGLRKIANTATQLGARLEGIGDAIMGKGVDEDDDYDDGLCDSCRHSNTCEACMSGGMINDDDDEPPPLEESKIKYQTLVRNADTEANRKMADKIRSHMENADDPYPPPERNLPDSTMTPYGMSNKRPLKYNFDGFKHYDYNKTHNREMDKMVNWVTKNPEYWVSYLERGGQKTNGEEWEASQKDKAYWWDLLLPNTRVSDFPPNADGGLFNLPPRRYDEDYFQEESNLPLWLRNITGTGMEGGALGDDPNKPPNTPGTPRRQHTGPNPPPPPPPTPPPPIPFMPFLNQPQPAPFVQALNHQNVIANNPHLIMGPNFFGPPQPLQAQNQAPVAQQNLGAAFAAAAAAPPVQPLQAQAQAAAPAQGTPPSTPPQQIPPEEWNYDSPPPGGSGFSGLSDKGGYGSQGAGMMLNTYIGGIKMTAGRNTREEHSAVHTLNRMYGTGMETHTMPDGTEMPGRTHMEGGELSITSLIRGIRRGDDKEPATHTRQGQKITSMKGRGVDEEDDIDFDDIKWGSFTAMFKRFKKQNPHQKKIKDLKAFAQMIKKGKGKFSKKALQKANFYLNVIL